MNMAYNKLLLLIKFTRKIKNEKKTIECDYSRYLHLRCTFQKGRFCMVLGCAIITELP